MAEQNNQAERAAPEFDAEEAGIEILRFLQQRKASPAMIDKLITMSCAAGGYEVIRRRAALPAAVDAEGLPPLPKVGPICYAMAADVQEYKVPRVGNHLPGVYDVALWSTDQFRNGQREAIAADRRKQAALTQMIELGQEIGADQPLGVTDSEGGHAD